MSIVWDPPLPDDYHDRVLIHQLRNLCFNHWRWLRVDQVAAILDAYEAVEDQKERQKARDQQMMDRIRGKISPE